MMQRKCNGILTNTWEKTVSLSPSEMPKSEIVDGVTTLASLFVITKFSLHAKLVQNTFQ